MPLLSQARSLPPYLPSLHVPPQADRSPHPSPRQSGPLTRQGEWRLAPLGARLDAPPLQEGDLATHQP